MLSKLQRIELQPLRAVWHVETLGCLDRILDFDSLSLIISAVPDEDTINFEVVDTSAADPLIAVNVKASSMKIGRVGELA